MNFAVIGAAGFVGRHLCSSLRAAGHTCAGFDLAPPDGSSDAVTRCDIARDAPAFDPGLDAAIYLAQFPGYRSFPRQAAELFAVNVTCALRAAEAAADAGATTFIYASTGTVYAPGFEPMAEDHPVRRDQPYASSKVHAEEALALVDNIRTCCVRLFGVFGEGQRTMLVPAITNRIRQQHPVTVEANPHDPADDGGLRISLTHVSDVCTVLEQLARRIDTGDETPRILNLAAPEPTSIRRLAETIAARLDLDPQIERTQTPRASDYIADIARLQRIIPHEYLRLEGAIDQTLAADA